jgi:hypothetical protein
VSKEPGREIKQLYETFLYEKQQVCLKYNFEWRNSERLLCVTNRKIPMIMNAAE